MEETKNIQMWFETMNDAAPSKYKEQLFVEYIAPSVGTLNESDVTNEVLYNFLDTINEMNLVEGKVIDILSLLRSILLFISRETGTELPLPYMKPEVFKSKGISNRNAYLLNNLLTASCERHAAAFWLLLHTKLSLSTVLRLKSTNISIKNDNLILKYDRRTRIQNKEKKQNLKYLETLILSPEEKSLTFWREILKKVAGDGDAYLVSGTLQPEPRHTLEISLNLLAGKCGLCNLSLKELSETEWLGDEVVDDAANFMPDLYEIDKNRHEKENFEIKYSALLDKLNLVLEGLQMPVQEHCQRTVQIAEFIVEHLRDKPWFIETDFDLDSLAVAIYYHDIGKSRLILDDYYVNSKSTLEQNNRYRMHVENGVKLLAEIIGKDTDELPDTSFPGVIRDAIADHHERVDGKGFPQGKCGEEISLVGRICAIADTVDRYLFFSDSVENDTSKVLDRIFSGVGTCFDARLVSILADNRDLFVAFLDELRSVFYHRRTEDAYGMRYVFHPYVDKNNVVVLSEAHLFFNDPYYGLLDSDKILPVVEDHPRYALFMKLEIKRICRLIGMANELQQKVPLVCMHVSLKEVMKESFFATVFQTFVDCGIRYHQLMFSIDEADIIDNGVDVSDLSEKFHVIGSLMGISKFGGEATLLPTLSRIRPDAIILQEKYGQNTDNALNLDFVGIVNQTARKIGCSVYCTGVEEKKQQDILLQTGTQYFGGPFAGVEQSEAEFIGKNKVMNIVTLEN